LDLAFSVSRARQGRSKTNAMFIIAGSSMLYLGYNFLKLKWFNYFAVG